MGVVWSPGTRTPDGELWDDYNLSQQKINDVNGNKINSYIVIDGVDCSSIN